MKYIQPLTNRLRLCLSNSLFKSHFLILFSVVLLQSCGSSGGGGSSSGGGTQIPSTPTNLVASASGDSVSLSWSSVDNSTYYEIYRHTVSESSQAGMIDQPLPNDNPSYQDNTPNTTSTYYYWVKACNSSGCSGVSSATVVANPRQISSLPLNDTGITWGRDYPSGNNETCTSNITHHQDCHQGRDAQALAGTLDKTGDGMASFDFTKLGSDGSALSIQNATWSASGSEATGTTWSCVRDNVTGLIWEVKTVDGGIHDKDNTYSWGGTTAIGHGHPEKEGEYYDDSHEKVIDGTYSSWDSLVNGSNAEFLCGYSDWRVPTLTELLSIAHQGTTNPSIDTNYFPNTQSTWYWSASPNAYDTYFAWLLDFEYGYDNNYFRSINNHVRLVRGG